MKSPLHYLHRAFSMTPWMVVRKIISKISKRYIEEGERRRDLTSCTFGSAGFTQGRSLTPRKMDLTDALTFLPLPNVLEKSRRSLAHEFNLLGSGWVRVHYGLTCAGLEGHVFPAGEKVRADSKGNWLSQMSHEKNLPVSRRIWGLISHPYEPIDWQLDFKSGFRWSESTLSREINFGQRLGQDVKVPWELARMQHLPSLAWAFAFSLQKKQGFEAPEVYLREFQNQILDFIATNPPRYGVNWSCTMDVAIRVANWVMAFDLFHSLGGHFDEAFEQTLAWSVYDHAHHINHHLEWDPLLRSNHYLADIAGLLFASLHLKGNPQAEEWINFSRGELEKEVESQFQSDGSNFEASTSYHRLSSEMALYASALMGGHIFQGTKGVNSFQENHWARLRRAAEFTQDMTRPDGRVIQVGDNDNGRFFKLVPMEENSLNHRHLIAAFNGIFTRSDWIEYAKGFEAETEVVRQLAGGRVTTQEALPPVGSGRIAYPDFGIFQFHQGPWRIWVRCGSVGQKGNGGHSHNDQLSFELCLGDHSLLVDPGSFVYTPLPEERNRFRSTALHNTLSLNGLEQNPMGPELFLLEDKAHGQVIELSDHHFIGEHKGFGEFHRRTLKINEKGLQGLDECKTDGIKLIYFHAAPGWGTRVENLHQAQLIKESKRVNFLSTDGEWSVEEYPYSSEYGKKELSNVLVFKSSLNQISWKIEEGDH